MEHFRLLSFFFNGENLQVCKKISLYGSKVNKPNKIGYYYITSTEDFIEIYKNAKHSVFSSVNRKVKVHYIHL